MKKSIWSTLVVGVQGMAADVFAGAVTMGANAVDQTAHRAAKAASETTQRIVSVGEAIGSVVAPFIDPVVDIANVATMLLETLNRRPGQSMQVVRLVANAKQRRAIRSAEEATLYLVPLMLTGCMLPVARSGIQTLGGLPMPKEVRLGFVGRFVISGSSYLTAVPARAA